MPSSQRVIRNGFSLVEISIVLAILSVVLSGLLPYVTETTKGREADTTAERLDRIEEALIQFYIANNARIPCPADPTVAISAAAFGDGAGNPATPTCTASNLLSSGNARGGAVPIKQLGLPDEYAFDGWGRKFLYNVDITSTQTNFTADGALNVKVTYNGAAATNLTQTGSYVIVSHGPNGHGGYTRGGGATRMSSGSTNDDERENCSVQSNANCSTATYNAIFVKKSPTAGTTSGATFDDVLRYKPTALLRNVLGPTGLWAPNGAHIYNTNTAGNVGVGITNPSYKFHVNGNVAGNYVAVFNNANTHGINATATTYGVVGYASTAGGHGVLGQNTAHTSYGYLGSTVHGVVGVGSSAGGGNGVYGQAANNNGVYGLVTPANATYYGVWGANGAYGAGLGRSDGYSIVGTGHAWFQGNLYVNGAGNGAYSPAYYHTSDRTLKSNIQTAPGLDIISKLRGVSFNWKETGKKAWGVIAQEIEKILPELISTDNKGIKSVDYDQLIGPMIQAINELHEQNKQLRRELDEVKRELGMRGRVSVPDDANGIRYTQPPRNHRR